MSQLDPNRLQNLVLVRLLVPRKKAASLTQLTGELSKDLISQHPDADLTRLIDAAVRDAERRNLVSLVAPPKGGEARPALTDAGRRDALTILGIKSVPASFRWAQARNLLAMQALAPAKMSSKKLDADALATQILIAQHGLPASVNTLTQAVERMAWRALDVDTDAPFTAAAVQRHLLRGLVPSDTRAKGDVWRRMLAMRAVHARGHTADALARALLLGAKPVQASAGRAKPSSAVVSNNNSVQSTQQPSLADFARAVSNAARNPQVARFHGDRAFIGSVWEHMRASRLIGEMSLDEFKATLVSAHRRQLIEIVRADLVGAMDPNEVRRSEARYDNATYHFVALNAGGL